MELLVNVFRYFILFSEKGLLDPETARQYRENVLEPGGSKKAVRLVNDFLGRKYSFDAFKNYINQEEINGN